MPRPPLPPSRVTPRPHYAQIGAAGQALLGTLRKSFSRVSELIIHVYRQKLQGPPLAMAQELPSQRESLTLILNLLGILSMLIFVPSQFCDGIR